MQHQIIFLFCFIAHVASTTTPSASASSSFIFLADLHIGEGCNTSSTNYQLNDTNCYSVRDLQATISKINALVSNTSLIIIGGDITSSAQITEFQAAQKYLSKLQSPWIATIGNHDVWSYDQIIGDRTKTPMGDKLFSSIFHDSFVAMSTLGHLTYPNITARSKNNSKSLHGQSWTLKPGKTFAKGLQTLTFVAPDFNTRNRAPPPCPGHSPIGGCGVTGNADFNNISNGTGGSWQWFENEIKTNVRTNDTVFYISHQPFRCREGVPDWYFCYSKTMKQEFRTLIQRYELEPAFERGASLNGHQHRWFDGSCFDEWPHFKQFEVSAVKGDVFDAKMSSSFAIFEIDDVGSTTGIQRWWRENKIWMSSMSSTIVQ